MKENRLFDILGDIDDKYIEEAAPKTDKAKRKNALMFRYIGLAAGIFIIVGIGITMWHDGFRDDVYSSNDKRWPEKMVYVDDDNEKDEIGYVPKWDEMTISEQFTEFEYNSATYGTRVTDIGIENIGNSMGLVTLQGYDIYTDTTYTTKGTIYEISNISSECALALQFEDTTDYYVYVNAWYRPETLGEFINMLNLSETMSLGEAHYKYYTGEDYINIEFEDFDDEIVWNMLLDDGEALNVYSDKEMYVSIMSIRVDIPMLGYENIGLSVTEEGYLVTNILNSGKAFYIGEEKVQAFVNYIINNINGYEIVYVDRNQSSVPENEGAKEDMSYIEVHTSGGYNEE